MSRTLRPYLPPRCRRPILAAAALLLCLAGSGRAAAQGLVHLDRAVAVVGEQVVTASDVQLAWVLAGHDPGTLAVLAAPDSADAAERWWVQQVMIRQLAADVAVYQPGAAEVRTRVQTLRDALGDDPAWSALQVRLGLDRAGLEAWVRNRLVVERFVLRNIGALGRRGEVGDVDPDRYADWLARIQGSLSVRRIAAVQEDP